MSVSHLVLNLAKLVEFHSRYAQILPVQERAAWRSVRKELEKREVVKFRNSVIGYIWDREKDRPLFDSEVDAYIARIAKNDPVDFVEWIIGQTPHTKAQSIVSLLERTRNQLRDTHRITNAEAQI
jgi:hypothetical protein